MDGPDVVAFCLSLPDDVIALVAKVEPRELVGGAVEFCKPAKVSANSALSKVQRTRPARKTQKDCFYYGRHALPQVALVKDLRGGSTKLGLHVVQRAATHKKHAPCVAAHVPHSKYCLDTS
jgi:hypothetical protein